MWPDHKNERIEKLSRYIPGSSIKIVECLNPFSRPFQILLHIQILNTVNLGFPATVDDILAGNLTEAMFGLGTLFSVDQMSVLIRHDLLTVLDLIDLASESGGVAHDHTKFTNRKLQLEDLPFRVSNLRFQQDDDFHHAVNSIYQLAFFV